MEDFESKMQSSVFFVETNSFEHLSLWREWKNEWNYKQEDWEQDNTGHIVEVGRISNHKNKPVCVSFTFAKLFGQRVCFYYVCSNFSDYQMVEKWFKTNYPKTYDNGRRVAKTDAMNFHHAVHECKRLANIK